MKKFLKALAALAALALVSTSFIACSDDDDEKDSAVVFEGTGTDEAGTRTVTFKDGNFVVHVNSSVNDSSITMTLDFDERKGTYTGDPSKDGDVKMKITHMADTESEEASQKVEQKCSAAAEAGSTSVKITNEDFPLTDLPSSKQTEFTISIIDGKITYDEIVYTRK